MSGDDQDDSQKTEEPTHKRLEEAFKRGQTANSREVVNFVMLLALMASLFIALPHAIQMSVRYFAVFATEPHQFFTDEGALRRLGWDLWLKGLLIGLLLVGGTIIAAIAGNLLQRRMVWSWEPVKPKWDKISPVKGWQRIFSRRSLVEFLKGLIKITIVGLAGAWVLLPYEGFLHQLPAYDMAGSARFMDEMAFKMMMAITIAVCFIAIFDYFYQRMEFMKQMRMSREEIKKEFKEQEGDPHIKAKIKAIRMERSRKRMMANVPQADVVITNPTHFAIALKYDRATMVAPMVVAKGQDRVALKIREIAQENDVPIVENPPLARALHASVNLEEEIPVEHYQAVAEIIGYVYKMRGKLK